MTDEEISHLEDAIAGSAQVIWRPDHETARFVEHIAFRHDEPSAVAYVGGGHRGDYVALYNAPLEHFYAVVQLTLESTDRK